jgi:hypothetical protein
MLTAELAIIQSELGLTNADFPRFLKEEHKYLEALKQPPEKDLLSVWYVEVLNELVECRYVMTTILLICGPDTRSLGLIGT